jgi:site-specific recombinase XerD
MPDTKHVPILLEMMFGESARVWVKTASERLLAWAQAFDEWIESRKGGRKGMVNNPLRSWKLLLELVGKPPWEMTREDIESYRAWLEERKLAPSTVRHAITHISLFYSWCSQRATDAETGPGFNPAEGVYKHSDQGYSKSQLLTEEESTALLRILKHDEWLLSKRDYAFFLCRLWMGVPFQALQKLKWGQIQVLEDGAWVDWGPEKRSTCLPEEAWEAILAYLEAAGRIGEKRPEGMPTEAYIFAPLADPLGTDAGGLASDWDEKRYLGSQQIWRSLKTYGNLAGIPDEKLTLSNLRFTASAQFLEAAGNREEMDAFLGSPGKRATMEFRKNMRVIQARHMKDIQRKRRKPPSEPVEMPARKSHRYRSEEKFQHGLYAASQPEEELEEMLAKDKTGLDEEIQGLRKLMERVMWLQLRTEDDTQAAALIHVYLAASPRLAELLKIKDTFDEVTPRDNEILQFMNFCFENVGMPILDIHQLREGVLDRDPIAKAKTDELVQVIAGDRLVVRSLFLMAMETEDPLKLAHYVQEYYRGCYRLARMLGEVKGPHGFLDAWLNWAVDEAIRQQQEIWAEETRLIKEGVLTLKDVFPPECHYRPEEDVE